MEDCDLPLSGASLTGDHPIWVLAPQLMRLAEAADDEHPVWYTVQQVLTDAADDLGISLNAEEVIDGDETEW
jgi:hypothetical protein